MATPIRWWAATWVAVLSCVGSLLAADEAGELVTVDADSVVAYVESCRKPNGAFGPADQEYTDAAWNYPAVQTLLLLGKKVAQPESVLKNGLGYPAGHAGMGHWLFFHQHQIRHLLGRPITPQHRRVELVHQGYEVRYYGSPFGTEGAVHFAAGTGAKYDEQDAAAEKLGYYNLSSLYYLLAGLKASGREPANPQELAAYIRRCQAQGGGFVDLRTAEAKPDDRDAKIAHTFYAVASLKLLAAPVPDAKRCADFLRACQQPNGEFVWHPMADNPRPSHDIYETWAALRALELLGEKPQRIGACRQWINALQNADGGFGDRPGWRSRLYSTYYAVDALVALGGLARESITAKQVKKTSVEPIPEGRFQIYQGLFKTPTVEPGDLAGLSKRGLNLLGLKSDKFDDAERLLPAIQEGKLPLDIVLCPEAYPHRLTRAGGLVLNHVGNFTLDPRWDADQRARWQAADAAGRQSLPWDDYRRQVIEPLRKLGSLCYPEQDFEQEWAYRSYDEGGYNAILAGFNWAPRDFVRVFPWRERYVDKLTPIADCDAHGDLAKWSPQLDHVRHLFIARGPTYADFLEAAANRRVVCVIAQPEGVASGVTYYGPPAAVQYVRKRRAEWQWWDQQ